MLVKDNPGEPIKINHIWRIQLICAAMNMGSASYGAMRWWSMPPNMVYFHHTNLAELVVTCLSVASF
jgi:hypothetical protein